MQYLYNSRSPRQVFAQFYNHSAEKTQILAFTDSDFANDVRDQKSFSGNAIYIDSMLVSWSSTEQTIVAQSTNEAEIIVKTIGFMPFQLNCNATKSSQIKKAKEQPVQEYKTLGSLDKIQKVGKIVNFRATILQKNEVRANLIVIKIRQRDGMIYEANSRKEKDD